MDSPVAVVKASISPGKIIAYVATGIAVMALLDLLGLTQYFFYPVTTLRAKFARQ